MASTVWVRNPVLCRRSRHPAGDKTQASVVPSMAPELDEISGIPSSSEISESRVPPGLTWLTWEDVQKLCSAVCGERVSSIRM